MVLDALIKIKNEIDTDAHLSAVRCREGICGSCAMNIDGKECAGPASAPAPMSKRDIQDLSAARTLPVIKDFGARSGPNFYAQYASIKAVAGRPRTPPPGRTASGLAVQRGPGEGGPALGLHPFAPAVPRVCPSYWWNSDRYLGPAALVGRVPLDRGQAAMRRRGERLDYPRRSIPALPLSYHHELHRGLPQGT